MFHLRRFIRRRVADLEDLLPTRDGGPEAAYARSLLLEAPEQALAELPSEQRDVFIGTSWKDGVSR
jgi:DNA-directed RNA polymerase specialized sigma24 family protein